VKKEERIVAADSHRDTKGTEWVADRVGEVEDSRRGAVRAA
jgi:hypothetical protein